MTQPSPDAPEESPLAGDATTAALFAQLVALVNALALLIAPAGSGNGWAGLSLWREIRRGLRTAEGLFRRLALVPAIAATAHMPAGNQRPARHATEGAAPAALPPLGGRWGPIRLHETRPERESHSGGNTPALADPYGLLQMPLRSEFARFAALIAAISNPHAAIFRLARILKRRQQRTSAPLPVSLAWRTASPGPSEVNRTLGELASQLTAKPAQPKPP